MDTQPIEAVANDANAPVDAEANPADYFEQLAADEFGIDEKQEPAEGEAAEGTDDEPEIEEEADDLPPIDAPVSWDTEAKEKFAELPREVQEYVTKRESERERFVQQKSQEASRAKQEVEQAALQQLATIERQYAEHWKSVADAISPRRPDAALLATNPYEYAAQQQKYDDALAQREQAQQAAQQYAQQSRQREASAEQARQADEHRTIVEHFPEYLDPTTGPKLRAELSAVAKELGYPDELIGQARAQDILAMRRVADLKAKADKYDAINAKRMEKVRAAKGLPKVAKPGVSQGSDQLRANRANAAFDRAKNSRNAQERGAGFLEYLQSTGQI